VKQLLTIADLALHVVHLVTVFFCLTGWIIPDLRMAHLYLIILIAFSWFGLGIFFGYGFCLVTDLQWKVKKHLGEWPLPRTYIKYLLDKLTGKNLNAKTVSIFTQLAFYFSALASVYVNFF
jgi:hypothetical protein